MATTTKTLRADVPVGAEAVYAEWHHSTGAALYRVVVTDIPNPGWVWAKVRPVGAKPRFWPGGREPEHQVLRERLFADEATARAWLVHQCKLAVQRAERALAKVRTMPVA